MATNQVRIHCFDWEDSVQVIDSAPEKYFVLGQGSVCGIRQIDTETIANDFGEPKGTVLYLVENAFGEAVEIPERFLVALLDE